MFCLRNIFIVYIGNGQPGEPALCQLYRHTFAPHGSVSPWRRCNVSRVSGFTDDVTFALSGHDQAARTKASYIQNDCADLTPRWILKLTHQGAAPDQGRNRISTIDCLVNNGSCVLQTNHLMMLIATAVTSTKIPTRYIYIYIYKLFVLRNSDIFWLRNLNKSASIRLHRTTAWRCPLLRIDRRR